VAVAVAVEETPLKILQYLVAVAVLVALDEFLCL
jgi:hypothetical protein